MQASGSRPPVMPEEEAMPEEVTPGEETSAGDTERGDDVAGEDDESWGSWVPPKRFKR
jgi:hypothetical protein